MSESFDHVPPRLPTPPPLQRPGGEGAAKKPLEIIPNAGSRAVRSQDSPPPPPPPPPVTGSGVNGGVGRGNAGKGFVWEWVWVAGDCDERALWL